jgi:hypothetical protein
MNNRVSILASFAAMSCVFAVPAKAATRTYSATLGGDSVTSKTGSVATGAARIVIDDESESVSMTIDVSGISVGQLSSAMIKAPIGPIHLHVYPSHDLTNDTGVSLGLPVPFGPAYRDNGTGFSVQMTDYPYATGAALLGSKASLEGFIEALDRGDVVLNIHTNAFPGGEISGTIVKS